MPESRPAEVAGVTMRDLLAACTAARAVSLPPETPEDRPEESRDRTEPTAPAVVSRRSG